MFCFSNTYFKKQRIYKNGYRNLKLQQTIFSKFNNSTKASELTSFIFFDFFKNLSIEKVLVLIINLNMFLS